jgi:ferritin-like metal-binding protein YciE
MNIRNLNDLFLHDLMDTHAADRLIYDALPRMATMAPAQAEALNEFMLQTKERISRLEPISASLDPSSDTANGAAMAGILAQIDDLIGIEEQIAREAAVFSVVQTVRHYLVARYATLESLANLLGKSDLAKRLLATLEVERATLSQPTSAGESRCDKNGSKDLTMGERLTELFDHKS